MTYSLILDLPGELPVTSLVSASEKMCFRLQPRSFREMVKFFSLRYK